MVSPFWEIFIFRTKEKSLIIRLLMIACLGKFTWLSSLIRLVGVKQDLTLDKAKKTGVVIQQQIGERKNDVWVVIARPTRLPSVA